MNERFVNGIIEFNNDILMRDCGEVTLAFNPETSDMFEFNETGAEVFELLKEGLQYKEIIDKLCTDYDVKPEEIYEDIDEILMRMEDVGIINVQ